VPGLRWSGRRLTVATYPRPLLADDTLADLTGLSQPAARGGLDKCPKIAQHFPMLGVLRLIRLQRLTACPAAAGINGGR